MSLPIAIELFVRCYYCDIDLEAQFITDTLFIKPCPECEIKAMEEQHVGYVEGYEDGVRDANI